MPYIDTARVRLFHADCREVLRELEPESIDSCATDPPYELDEKGEYLPIIEARLRHWAPRGLRARLSSVLPLTKQKPRGRRRTRGFFLTIDHKEATSEC